MDASGADAPGAADAPAGAIDSVPPDADRCPVGAEETVPATITLTADDNVRLLVNGAIVDEVPHPWNQAAQYTVPIFRHPRRRNLIALEGANVVGVDGLDRGVLLDLRYTVDGSTYRVVSGAGWRVSPALEAGWETLAFDDAAWEAPVVLGPHGMAPWNDVFGVLAPATAAEWLWTYAATALAADKPAAETIYLRRTFYLDVTGGPADVPPECP